MKSYESKIAKNDKVELIHISLENEVAATKWAEKTQFPWLTVLSKSVKSSGLRKYAGGGVPHYVLIDKDGNQVVKGKGPSFEKISKLRKR